MENKLLLSQISIKINREIEAKYIEFNYEKLLTKNIPKKNLTNKFDVKENWKKGSKKSREKSYYYRNVMELGKSSFSQFTQTDFDEKISCDANVNQKKIN